MKALTTLVPYIAIPYFGVSCIALVLRLTKGGFVKKIQELAFLGGFGETVT